jgi:hypothetical protein
VLRLRPRIPRAPVRYARGALEVIEDGFCLSYAVRVVKAIELPSAPGAIQFDYRQLIAFRTPSVRKAGVAKKKRVG